MYNKIIITKTIFVSSNVNIDYGILISVIGDSYSYYKGRGMKLLCAVLLKNLQMMVLNRVFNKTVNRLF